MAVNRRYQRVRNERILKQLALHKTAEGMQCDPTPVNAPKDCDIRLWWRWQRRPTFVVANGEQLQTFAEVQRLKAGDQDYRLDRLSWDELTEKWRRA